MKKKKSKKKKIVLSFFGLVFVAGIYFLTPKMTGNVIGNFESTQSTFLGIGLIIVALFGFYFSSKFLSDYL